MGRGSRSVTNKENGGGGGGGGEAPRLVTMAAPRRPLYIRQRVQIGGKAQDRGRVHVCVRGRHARIMERMTFIQQIAFESAK